VNAIRQPPRACPEQLNEKLGSLPVTCIAGGDAAQGNDHVQGTLQG
jgi:hypothetical protein